MSKPHKWAKEIKAWADGAEIEFRDPLQGWVECKNPSWTEAAIYRIKPQPKEPQYLYAVLLIDGTVKLGVGGQLTPLSKGESVHKIIGKIKLENEE